MSGRAATAKQSRFAQGIVSGKTKVDAYALAYPDDKSTRRALIVQASRRSKVPAVQAEIERLRKEPIILESFPDASNPKALRAHAVATMARLTSYPDPLVQLHAANWLRDFADTLDRAPAADGNAGLIADLRGLYRKALEASPLIETVDAVAETAESAPKL